MPRQKRIKTRYPGVYAVQVGKARAFYIHYRKDGDPRLIEEKAEIPGKTMTAALANQLRTERIKGKVPTNRERRETARQVEEAEKERVTISSLWKTYREKHEKMPSFHSDKSRYERFIEPSFGDKELHEIIALDIDRLERKVLKGKAAQTIKHVFGLLQRIANEGDGLSVKIKNPSIDNTVTETLSEGQLKALIKALDESPDAQIANCMRLALYTGMRRGELFKLKWSDVDFEKGFIFIRHPKGKKSTHIPLNDQAKNLLESHQRVAENVFVNTKGKPFSDPRQRIDAVRKAAGLPEGFRPMHGLRHVYASLLASSGKVDIYTLQRLLTHKSTAMTQRYAHILDESLRRASNVIGDILQGTKTKS